MKQKPTVIDRMVFQKYRRALELYRDDAISIPVLPSEVRFMLDEIERLSSQRAEAERDAARYRWAVARNPLMVASIAYGVPSACRHSSVDDAIDAAIAATSIVGEGAKQ